MLLLAGESVPLSSLIDSTLVVNYSQEAVDLFLGATQKLTLRGGYRYVWGDALNAFLPPAGLARSAQEQLRQNIGIGSATYHPTQKISLTGKVEGASSSGVTSAPVSTTMRRCGRKCTINPCHRSTSRALLRSRIIKTRWRGPRFSSYQDQFTGRQAESNSSTSRVSHTRFTLRSNIGYLDPGTFAASSFNFGSGSI
jgi:hypothetical protein